MQVMKNTFALLLFAVLGMGLTGCMGEPDAPEGSTVYVQVRSIGQSGSNGICVGYWYKYAIDGPVQTGRRTIYVPDNGDWASMKVIAEYKRRTGDNSPTRAKVAQWIGQYMGTWVQVTI